MHFMNNKPIVAIATSSGYSGIGIIRISGTDLSIFKRKILKKIKLDPKRAYFCDFYIDNEKIIDSGIAIYFKGPNSFTGEDIIELQAHGSPVVLNILLNYTIKLGASLAKAGEFTRKAFINNKIDLLQAESIIDLIHADSEISVLAATQSLKGKFSNYINSINEKLKNLRIFVEACLDFPEEDVEFLENEKIKNQLEIICNELKHLITNANQGLLLNDGVNIAIIGKPNVGKSTLLNTLCDEDIAIVTEIAGTTRDIIEKKIIINGIPINIIDTAGIRETEDIVEILGIEKTKKAISNSNLCLILIDNNNFDNKILNLIPKNIPIVIVQNKIDLCKNIEENNNQIIKISAKEKINIESLKKEIIEKIGIKSNNDNVFTARTRHVIALKETLEYIDNAFRNWNHLEIIAEELKLAHEALGTITGRYSTEELLGDIFKNFCIGK